MWNSDGGVFFFFGGEVGGKLSHVHIEFLEALKFTGLGSAPWWLLPLFLFVTIEQPKLICLIVGKLKFLYLNRDGCQQVVVHSFYEARCSCNAHKTPTRMPIRNLLLMVHVEAPRLFSTF